MKEERFAFGDELLEFLDAHLINPHELSQETGLPYSTVARIVKGNSQRPNRDSVHSIVTGINKGLAQFKKRARYVRDAEGNWLVVRDLYDDEKIVVREEPPRGPEPEPQGLTKLRSRTDLREKFNITDEEIDIARTSRFYGGVQEKLTPEEWVEVIFLVKKLGLKKEE